MTTDKKNLPLFLLYFLLLTGVDVFFAIKGHDMKMLLLQLAHGYLFAFLLTLLDGIIPWKKGRLAIRIPFIVILSAVFLARCVYYIEYYSDLSEDVIASILGTNPSESTEFVKLHLVGFIWSLLLMMVPFAVFILCKKWSPRISRPVFIVSLVLLVPCLALLGFYHKDSRRLIASSSPEGVFYMFFHYLSSIPDNYSQFAVPAGLEVIDGQPDNIVIVFGESQCRSHCQFNGYDKVTMPEVQKLIDDGHIRAFDKVTSAGIHTIESFRAMMTTYRPEYKDSVRFYTCQTIPQVIRDAGYRSTWISNQSKKGLFDNVIEKFSALCDTVLFISDQPGSKGRKTLDEELIPVTTQVLRDSLAAKNFYVIHLMGSHATFKDRYPEDYHPFLESDYADRPENQREMYVTYDNSIHYTDSVLGKLIDLFKDKETILIYLSDHGIDFFASRDDYCAHAVEIDPVSVSSASEVPFLIYTSDLYQQHFPSVCERISRNTGREFRTDSLIYTVMDIAGVAFKDPPKETPYSSLLQ